MSTIPGRSNDPEPTNVAGGTGFVILSWLWVGIPLAWGVWKTSMQLPALFQ